MSKISRPRILRPEILTRLKRQNLMTLLRPFDRYFAQRGVPLHDLNESDLPLAELCAVLASPSESTPPDLVERLELLDLIAHADSALHFEDGYASLIKSLREEGDSIEDMAAKIILTAPDVAWREFDRQALAKPRVLTSYRVNHGLPLLPSMSQRMDALRDHLSPWFSQNARSAACQIHPREDDEGISFVIRHGDLLQRINVLEEDGSSASRVLRPERQDVAYYRRISHEWQISGVGHQLQEQYRKALGTVLHGSEFALVRSDRYSLEPLRDGADVLKCDFHGRVQLVELSMLRIELPNGSRVSFDRGRVFESVDSISPVLLRSVTLLEARLDFKISGRRKRIAVQITPGNDRITGVQFDPAIEAWLVERGFSNQTDESFVRASA